MGDVGDVHRLALCLVTVCWILCVLRSIVPNLSTCLFFFFFATNTPSSLVIRWAVIRFITLCSPFNGNWGDSGFVSALCSGCWMEIYLRRVLIMGTLRPVWSDGEKNGRGLDIPYTESYLANPVPRPPLPSQYIPISPHTLLRSPSDPTKAPNSKAVVIKT